MWIVGLPVVSDLVEVVERRVDLDQLGGRLAVLGVVCLVGVMGGLTDLRVRRGHSA